jgi:tRNA (guanine26-N2/guanine27-N2)-dimethyltransferase
VINNVQERCRFSVNEVCKFLSEHIGRERRFGIVDLDPFGTPAPYLDCALRALADDGLLSITATDTPVLCGIYPDVSVRRYYGRSIHTEYGNEVGLRLLLGLISMTASRLELGVKPLFSHSTRNYLRVYLRLKVGSQYADAMPDSLGYIFHCFSCHNRSFGRRENSKTCCRCNKQMKTAGPLWIDRIMDSVFMDSMQDSLDKCKVDKKCERILAIAREEIGIPTYFSVDRIGEELKITPPAMANIIKALEERGFEASRTSLKASGFRTNAKHEEVLQVLRALVP